MWSGVLWGPNFTPLGKHHQLDAFVDVLQGRRKFWVALLILLEVPTSSPPAPPHPVSPSWVIRGTKPHLIVHQHYFVHMVALIGPEENSSFISLWLRPVACQGDASQVLDFTVKSLVQRQILSSLVLESIHQCTIIWHWFLHLVATQPCEKGSVPHLHGNNRIYFWYGVHGSTLWKW